MASQRTTGRAWIAAAIIGVMVGGLCFVVLSAHNKVQPTVRAADFQRSLNDARDLLAGRDPYRSTPGPLAIPYPLPAGILAIPLSWMPDVAAGSLFFGLSVMALAFGILRTGEDWRIGMLFSWSFAYALLWVQWTPLICALWFLPAVAAVALIKPHIALPLLVCGDFRRRLLEHWRWLIPPVLLAVVSLAWYPAWPVVWLKQLGTYQGILPPLFSMPVGPMVLLSLIAWRDRRAWLLVLLALMPQRMVYDQLPILLIANSPRQLWTLVAASWVNCIIFFQSEGGWTGVPWGWQNFILATLYLPAVAIVIWPRLTDAWKKWVPRTASYHPSEHRGLFSD